MRLEPAKKNVSIQKIKTQHAYVRPLRPTGPSSRPAPVLVMNWTRFLEYIHYGGWEPMIPSWEPENKHAISFAVTDLGPNVAPDA